MCQHFFPHIFIQVVPKFIMCHFHISLCILTDDIRGISRYLACWSHFSLPGHWNCLYTLISFAALFWFWGNDSNVRYMSYYALECVIIIENMIFWFWGNDSNIRYMSYYALECVIIIDNMIPIYCTGTLTACNDFWGIHATNERNIKKNWMLHIFFCHMVSVIVSHFYSQKWGICF
jgi:hypothetical protein